MGTVYYLYDKKRNEIFCIQKAYALAAWAEDAELQVVSEDDVYEMGHGGTESVPPVEIREPSQAETKADFDEFASKDYTELVCPCGSRWYSSGTVDLTDWKRRHSSHLVGDGDKTS